MPIIDFCSVFFSGIWKFFMLKVPGTDITFFAAFGLFPLLVIIIKIVKIFAGGDDGDGGN